MKISHALAFVFGFCIGGFVGWQFPPLVAVAELADSSVNFAVRPWVASGDYSGVRYDLNEKIKLSFDSVGISIPYPQLEIHKAA